jgi:hypothetical protein
VIIASQTSGINLELGAVDILTSYKELLRESPMDRYLNIKTNLSFARIA